MLFFFSRCHDRDQNAGARPTATSHERVTKQHDAAVRTENPQTARMKNDLKSFLLCPYNGPDEPRRASLRYTEHGVGSIRMLCRASNLLHLLPKLEADAGVLQRIRWKFLGGYVQEVIKMDESRFEMVGHLRGPDTAI